MGGFDDHVTVMGDWMPPSPSPRAFFSSISNDDTLIRSFTSSVSENKSCHYFQGPDEQDFLTEASTHEPKTSSRGGLMERRADRAGFNAPRLNTESIRHGDVCKDQDVRSPYLTIPPGLSPTTLLDSPVFLTNSLAQPSPTTGKFLFGPSGNSRNSTFIFKPIPESGSTHDFNPKNEVHASGFAPQPFPSFGISINSDSSCLHRSIEPSKTLTLDPQAENSPSLDEPREDDGDQKSSGQAEEDGYNWRKYGQKQVKGSEYPRSYYKCTHPICPVKKKVEGSYEGHITEIIYKGAHNHPKALPSRRYSPSLLGPPNGPGEILPPLEPERNGMSGDGNLVWSAQ